MSVSPPTSGTTAYSRRSGRSWTSSARAGQARKTASPTSARHTHPRCDTPGARPAAPMRLRKGRVCLRDLILGLRRAPYKSRWARRACVLGSAARYHSVAPTGTTLKEAADELPADRGNRRPAPCPRCLGPTGSSAVVRHRSRRDLGLRPVFRGLHGRPVPRRQLGRRQGIGGDRGWTLLLRSRRPDRGHHRLQLRQRQRMPSQAGRPSWCPS